MTHNYDSQYKELFRNPTVVAELLKSFVAEKFIHDLDFSTLERDPLDFLTKRLRRRETDIVYKINFKGDPIYIYLLMEFQSSVKRLALIEEHAKTINDLVEVTSMWSTAVKEHDSRVKVFDKQEILSDQFRTKFGQAEKANKKIRSTGDAKKLETALKKILSAENPEDVLKCLD